jgi:hypothetical protein
MVGDKAKGRAGEGFVRAFDASQYEPPEVRDSSTRTQPSGCSAAMVWQREAAVSLPASIDTDRNTFSAVVVKKIGR